MACACVIVPLVTSDPSGPQLGALEMLDPTAAVLVAAAGAPVAASAVALPPPARRPTAARPASSFLFMMCPLRSSLPYLILRKSSGPEDLCREARRRSCAQGGLSA